MLIFNYLHYNIRTVEILVTWLYITNNNTSFVFPEISTVKKITENVETNISSIDEEEKMPVIISSYPLYNYLPSKLLSSYMEI